MNHAILWPVIGMILLTFITWVRLYFERIGEIRSRRISPQKIASRSTAAQTLQNTASADHLANLFEMPVLFYVLCLSLILTSMDSYIFLAGAWLYVCLRAVHAFIHMTYNRVLHRFFSYVASSGVLFIMWALFAWRLATS